jgi:Zn-dependent M28 family amino/carboxypeptidase
MADIRPDSGALLAVTSKRSEKSPDYFGEIVIDLSNKTKLDKQGDLLIVKLSGWKKKSKAGNTFLSLAVDRFVPKNQAEPKNDMDEDIPF